MDNHHFCHISSITSVFIAAIFVQCLRKKKRKKKSVGSTDIKKSMGVVPMHLTIKNKNASVGSKATLPLLGSKSVENSRKSVKQKVEFKAAVTKKDTEKSKDALPNTRHMTTEDEGPTADPTTVTVDQAEPVLVKPMSDVKLKELCANFLKKHKDDEKTAENTPSVDGGGGTPPEDDDETRSKTQDQEADANIAQIPPSAKLPKDSNRKETKPKGKSAEYLPIAALSPKTAVIVAEPPQSLKPKTPTTTKSSDMSRESTCGSKEPITALPVLPENSMLAQPTQLTNVRNSLCNETTAKSPRVVSVEMPER